MSKATRTTGDRHANRAGDKSRPTPLTNAERQARRYARYRKMVALFTKLRDGDYPREVRDIAIDALKGIAE